MEKNKTRLIQQYTGFLLSPVIIAAIFQIVALNNTNTTALIIATHALLVVVVCGRSIQIHAPWTTAAVAGGLAGTAVAAIAALYKLVVTFNVVTAFNLFTEPLLTGIIDEITTGALTLVALSFLKLLHRRSSPPTTNKQ